MIDYFMSNNALLVFLGNQLKQMRLNARLTQEDLALRTGVSRVTIDRLENGKGAKLETFVAVLRGLQKLEILNNFETEAITSPLLIAKMEGNQPQRVYKKRSDK